MTILPKKKPSQAANNQENDGGESSNSGVHPNQLSHHQLQSNHIQPAVGSPGLNSVHDDCGGLSPTQHYDDDRSNGASSPSANASHNKRRASYRASPLRSVRPKLREHRVGGGCGGGGSSPTYAGHPINNIPHNISPLSISTSPLPPPLSPQAGPSSVNENNGEDAANNGYNSGDEYEPININCTPQEWLEKERWFEKKMKKKGLVIKQMMEDGACLFRAIADQVYGDQDMHDMVRKHCMDYVEANAEMFSPFVSENFQTYVNRKRQHDCFGNHVEIAAMSEIYNRVIEVYCYSSEPINIFATSARAGNPSIRLSYHKGTHYNSLVDPFKPTYGVGLGLPNLVPGLADKNLMKDATRMSENFHIEQAMLEDKIRATDFEATTEAIEEQVANESYLEYVRDMEKRKKAQQRIGASSSSSSTVSQTSSQSALVTENTNSSPPHPSSRKSPPHRSLRNSPSRSHRTSPRNSPRYDPSASPKATKSGCKKENKSEGNADLAVPGSSKDPVPSCSNNDTKEFALDEKASFLQDLPPDMFGLGDYSANEFDVLAHVLATSQQEYLDSLKRSKEES